MAVFSGINNPNILNPGFTFANWESSIDSAHDSIGALALALESSASNFGQNSDGSYWVEWADGTSLWFDGTYNASTEIASITELELSGSSGLTFGFTGKATWNTATDSGQLSSVTAKEVWIDSEDGFSIAYQGALNFNIADGVVSGNVKNLYMLADNGSEPGDAYYVKLSGAVTVDADGNFTGGLVKTLSWGNVTFSDDDNPTFVVTKEITGLKINATDLETALEGGFNGLMQLAYGGNDTITGTADADTLYGMAGNDKIDGGAGDDFIYGGAGNDTITGGLGDDFIWGDTASADINATLTVAADKITDLDGNNVIRAGAGNNVVTTGNGNDWVGAGRGNDKYIVGGGDDASDMLVVDGSFASYTDSEFADREFHNVVIDWNGNNSITAGDGDDYIRTDFETAINDGVDGNNKIIAGNGDNVIQVGDGNNNITAGSGNDIIWADRGNNKVVAGDGNNIVDLGLESAFDTYLASGGTTKGNGNNVVTTGSGDDYVSTWEGNDVVKVGTGSDEVNLGSGKNTVDLGADSDADLVWFDDDFFAALLDGVAGTVASTSVKNFNVDDTLAFYYDGNNDDINDLAALTADDVLIGSGAAPSNAGDASLILDTKSGKLYYDADGSGSDVAVQIGLIKGTGLSTATFYNDVDGVYIAA